MDYNFFFIDGSALLNDIKRYKDEHPQLKEKKFNPLTFSSVFQYKYELSKFHSREYKRIVFYFVNNDQRIKEYIEVPDFTKPWQLEDLEIKYCGKRIPAYSKAKEWLDKNKAPTSVTDSLYKSEKAVDTKICCDALILLSVNKLDRLFLYSNDYDFIPLCQAIKIMGANINLIKLTATRVNKDLVSECDGFHTFSDHEIFTFFGSELKSNNQSDIQ